MSLHDRIKDTFFPDSDLNKLRLQVSGIKSQVSSLIQSQGRSTAEWMKSRDRLYADMRALTSSQEQLRLAALDLNRRLEALEGAHADT